MKMFKNGIHLSLHQWIQKWMSFVGVVPHQMNPNMIRIMLLMNVLCI